MKHACPFSMCYIWRLLVLSVIIILFSNGSEITIHVGSGADGADEADTCNSTSIAYNTETCTLRLAWSYCLQTASLYHRCNIVLDESIIYLNASYGELTLQANSSINIEGNGAIVLHVPDVFSLHYRAIVYTTNISSTVTPTLNMSNVSFVGFGSVKTNGGAIFADGDCTLYWENVTFRSCVGNIGGAVYLSSNSRGPILVGCEFFRNSAVFGGSLAVESVEHLQLLGSTLSFSSALSEGGCVYIGSDNVGLTMTELVFSYCEAGAFGGGVLIGTQNDNLLLSNVSVTYCSAASGGGILIDRDNVNIRIEDITVDSCRAVNGGGVLINEGNSDCYITEAVVMFCVAAGGSGGGMILGSFNNNFTIVDSLLAYNQASGYAGGIGFPQNSFTMNITIDSLVVEYCVAGLGGGILFGSYVSDASIISTHIVGCATLLSGGGMAIGQEIVGLTILGSSITDCTSETETGGALVVDKSNYDLLFQESIFSGNYAKKAGGAVQVVDFNDGITFAGCDFIFNAAEYGGGVYVSKDTDNFVVLDTEGSNNRLVVETSHPYTAGSPTEENPYYIIMNQTVIVSNASELILLFDRRTAFGNTEVLTIYDSESRTVELYRFIQSFPENTPGIDIPSIRISGTSFYMEFVTSYAMSASGVSASTSGYGIRMYVYPVFSTYAKPSNFFGNFARKDGGAVELKSNIAFPLFINTIVSHNTAIRDGGGLYFRSNVPGTSIQQVTFIENESGLGGGALMLQSAHEGYIIKDCAFVRNEGVLGGAISMSSLNGIEDGVFVADPHIVIVGCVFSYNTAELGGAVYFGKQNSVVIDDCYFHLNIALAGGGGGVMAESLNTVLVYGSGFVENKADECGGALFGSNTNTIYLNAINMSNNVAIRDGGAICLKGESDVTFDGTSIIRSNMAGRGGGALAIFNCPLWYLAGRDSSVEFYGNSALWGSAVFIKSLIVLSDRELRNVSFVNNSASVGGTLYWLKDVFMSEEPPGSNSSMVHYVNNQAPYGVRTATQAVALSGPTQYNVTIYHTALHPSLLYTIVDYYGSTIPLTGYTSLIASMLHSDCDSELAYLDGADLYESGVAMRNGEAEFTQLEAYCSPNGTATVQIEARLGNLYGIPEHIASPYYLTTTTTLHFRQCVKGEYVLNGECTSCPAGTYNLSPGEGCRKCTGKEGISTCQGSNIVVQAGFWRRFDVSSIVFECNTKESCAGGPLTGDESCGEGYEGPLCSVCAENYFESDGVCKKCDASSSLRGITIIIYMVIAVCIFFTLAFGIYSRFKAALFKRLNAEITQKVVPVSSENPQVRLLPSSSADEESGNVICEKEALINNCSSPKNGSDNEDVHDDDTYSEESQIDMEKPAFMDLLNVTIAWIKLKSGTLTSKLKIVTATLQVVDAVSVVTAVSFPKSFALFTQALDFLSLDLMSALPWNCSQSFNFIDFMIFTTLAPIGISLILAICFVFEYMYKQAFCLGTEHAENKYVFAFLGLTYIVLPFVTTTIFQIFLCTDLDPENEDNFSVDSYLTADMTVSCQSTYYHVGFIYACVMIVVYPIGVLSMYLFLLSKNRYEIMHRNTMPGRDSWNTTHPLTVPTMSSVAPHSADTKCLHGDNVLSPEVERLSFLWESYKPEYWWFEICETSRRMVLTAVVSVVAPGTSQQIVFAIAIAFLYTKLYGYLSPYMESDDNIVSSMGIIQILVTFFCALIQHEDLLGRNYNEFIGIFLIFINIQVAVLSMYFAFRECQKDTIAELVEDETPIVKEPFRRRTSGSIIAANQFKSAIAKHRRATMVTEKRITQLSLRDDSPSTRTERRTKLEKVDKVH